MMASRFGRRDVTPGWALMHRQPMPADTAETSVDSLIKADAGQEERGGGCVLAWMVSAMRMACLSPRAVPFGGEPQDWQSVGPGRERGKLEEAKDEGAVRVWRPATRGPRSGARRGWKGRGRGRGRVQVWK